MEKKTQGLQYDPQTIHSTQKLFIEHPIYT